MAIAFEIGIRDLLTEFLADTFVVLCFLQMAGAIAALSFKSRLDLRDKLGVFIQSDRHIQSSQKYIFLTHLRTVGIESVRNPSIQPAIFKIRSSISKIPRLKII